MKGKSKPTKNSVPVASTAVSGEEHQFLLRPLSSQCYYFEDISLSLSPEYNKKTKTYLNVWPQINADGKEYMPFFLLEVDRESIVKKQGEYRQSQRQRINNAMESKNSILVPHPGKTRHTCFVCKSHYNDYKTHIQTKAHKTKLRSSRSQYIIKDLISLVQTGNEVQVRQVQTKSKLDIPRLTKKLVNQERFREFQLEILSNMNDGDEGEEVEFQLIDLEAENDLDQLKLKQPTEPSLNKNQQNQTLLNCYISNIQSFRVSDYLI